MEQKPCFFGLEVASGSKCKHTPQDAFLHLSQVALPLEGNSEGRVTLYCSVEGKAFALGSLNAGKGIFHMPIDLNFMPGQEIEFFVKSQSDAKVHITGYYEQEEFGDDLSEDEGEEDEEDEEDDEDSGSPLTLNKNVKPTTQQDKPKAAAETKPLQNKPAKPAPAKLQVEEEDEEDDEDEEGEEDDEGDEEGEEDGEEDDEEDEEGEEDEEEDDDDEEDDDEDTQASAKRQKISPSGDFKKPWAGKQDKQHGSGGRGNMNRGGQGNRGRFSPRGNSGGFSPRGNGGFGNRGNNQRGGFGNRGNNQRGGGFGGRGGFQSRGGRGGSFGGRGGQGNFRGRH